MEYSDFKNQVDNFFKNMSSAERSSFVDEFNSLQDDSITVDDYLLQIESSSVLFSDTINQMDVEKQPEASYDVTMNKEFKSEKAFNNAYEDYDCNSYDYSKVA